MTNAREVWDAAKEGTAFVTHWTTQKWDEPDVIWVKGPEFGGVNTLDWNELEWLIPVDISKAPKVFK